MIQKLKIWVRPRGVPQSWDVDRPLPGVPLQHIALVLLWQHIGYPKWHPDDGRPAYAVILCHHNNGRISPPSEKPLRIGRT